MNDELCKVFEINCLQNKYSSFSIYTFLKLID